MSIKLKLIVSFIGVSLIGVVIGLVGINSLLNVKSADEKSYRNGTEGIVIVMRFFMAYDSVKVAVRDSSLTSDPAEKTRIEGTYKKGVEDLKKYLDAYASTVADEQDRANYNRLRNATAEYLGLAAKLIVFGSAGKSQDAVNLMATPDATRIRDNMNLETQKVVDFNNDYVAVAFKTNSQAIDLAILLTCGILLVGIVVSIVLGLLVTNSITRPVKRVSAELREASRALESASGQVSSSSQQLSSSSNELASSIEEMTSSLEELQSIIEANTKNVNQSELLMQETLAESKKVSEKMSELKVALADISGNSKKISKIIKVIDDIAFQTNILALNAAVEAARAGDAGKGFAVVADQVKALAQKSADAAKETADLIEMAISAAEKGENLGTTASENQVLAVDKTSKVAVLLDEVNRASKEQLKGANQITQAVSQVNGVVQNTASSSEENAAAGEELLGQSESLADNVERLDAIINGKKRAKVPATPPEVRTSRKTESSNFVAHGKPGYSLPHPTHVSSGIEVTKPEDVIPLKDFKDF